MNKRLLTFSVLILFCNALFAQTGPCSSGSGGINGGGDTPPGCMLCQPEYFGSTKGYTPYLEPAAEFDFCGDIENNQFFSVMADENGFFSIQFDIGDCESGSGLEVMYFDQNLKTLGSCAKLNSTWRRQIMNTRPLTPGEIYWVMIDGIAGSVCDFKLTVLRGQLFTIPDPPGLIKATPNSSVICPETEVCYSIEPSQNADRYDWEIPSNAQIISGGQASDTEICLKYDSPGSGTVEVTPQNICYSSMPSILPVKVEGIPTIFFNENICSGGQLMVGNAVLTQPRTENLMLQNHLGCDSLVVFDFEIETSINLSANTTGSISCADGIVPIYLTVNNLPQNYTHEWSTTDGSFPPAEIGSQTLNTMSPGIYKFSVYDQVDQVVCVSSYKIVDNDFKPKIPQISWAENPCFGQTYTYRAEGKKSGERVIWEIENGTILSGNGTEQITIEWRPEQFGSLCVSFENDCTQSEKVCQDFSIKNRSTGHFEIDSTICQFRSMEVQFVPGYATNLTDFNWNIGNTQLLSGSLTSIDEPLELEFLEEGTNEISITISGNGCNAQTISTEVEVTKGVDPFEITCVTNYGEVIFEWPEVAGAIDYLPTISTGQPFEVDGRKVTVSNLGSFEWVSLRVQALSGNTCYNRSETIGCRSWECSEVYVYPQGLQEICINTPDSVKINKYVDNSRGGTGLGVDWFVGGHIDSSGYFYPEGLPGGDYPVILYYDEIGCIYTDTFNVHIFDNSPVKVDCEVDTFINALGLRWTRTEASNHQIFKNGDLFLTQEQTSLLYFPELGDDTLKFDVQPLTDSHCKFPLSSETCVVSGLSPSSAKETYFSSSVKVSPNPSSGIFNIKSELPIVQIEVFTASGKKVLETTDSRVDLSSFPKGVYFFKIKIDDFFVLKRGVLLKRF